MTDNKLQLVVQLPDENTPGYLKRRIAADKFTRELRDQRENDTPLSADFYDNLIEYLLGFVVEPADRKEAREVMLEASSAQHQALLDEIHKAQANPTSPEPTETS